MAVAISKRTPYPAHHPDGSTTWHRTGAAAMAARLKSERRAERAAEAAANKATRELSELAELIAEHRVMSLDELHGFKVTIRATGEAFRVVQGAGLFFKLEGDGTHYTCTACADMPAYGLFRDRVFHLYASSHPGYFYILDWNEERVRHECSCSWHIYHPFSPCRHEKSLQALLRVRYQAKQDEASNIAPRTNLLERKDSVELKRDIVPANALEVSAQCPVIASSGQSDDQRTPEKREQAALDAREHKFEMVGGVLVRLR